MAKSRVITTSISGGNKKNKVKKDKKTNKLSKTQNKDNDKSKEFLTSSSNDENMSENTIYPSSNEKKGAMANNEEGKDEAVELYFEVMMGPECLNVPTNDIEKMKLKQNEKWELINKFNCPESKNHKKKDQVSKKSLNKLLNSKKKTKQQIKNMIKQFTMEQYREQIDYQMQEKIEKKLKEDDKKSKLKNTSNGGLDREKEILLFLLQGLRIELTSKPIKWLIEFLGREEQEGIEIIIKALASLHFSQFASSHQLNPAQGSRKTIGLELDSQMEFEYIKILHICLNNQNILTKIMNNKILSEKVINEILFCFYSNLQSVRIISSKLLAIFIIDKFQTYVLQAFSFTSMYFNHPSIFTQIFNYLQFENSLELKVNCLVLINVLLFHEKQKKNYEKLKTQFLQLNIQEILQTLEKLYPYNEQQLFIETLHTQISKLKFILHHEFEEFDDNDEEDEEDELEVEQFELTLSDTDAITPLDDLSNFQSDNDVLFENSENNLQKFIRNSKINLNNLFDETSTEKQFNDELNAPYNPVDSLFNEFESNLEELHEKEFIIQHMREKSENNLSKFIKNSQINLKKLLTVKEDEQSQFILENMENDYFQNAENSLTEIIGSSNSEENREKSKLENEKFIESLKEELENEIKEMKTKYKQLEFTNEYLQNKLSEIQGNYNELENKHKPEFGELIKNQENQINLFIEEETNEKEKIRLNFEEMMENQKIEFTKRMKIKKEKIEILKENKNENEKMREEIEEQITNQNEFINKLNDQIQILNAINESLQTQIDIKDEKISDLIQLLEEERYKTLHFENMIEKIDKLKMKLKENREKFTENQENYKNEIQTLENKLKNQEDEIEGEKERMYRENEELKLEIENQIKLKEEPKKKMEEIKETKEILEEKLKILENEKTILEEKVNKITQKNKEMKIRENENEERMKELQENSEKTRAENLELIKKITETLQQEKQLEETKKMIESEKSKIKENKIKIKNEMEKLNQQEVLLTQQTKQIQENVRKIQEELPKINEEKSSLENTKDKLRSQIEQLMQQETRLNLDRVDLNKQFDNLESAKIKFNQEIAHFQNTKREKQLKLQQIASKLNNSMKLFEEEREEFNQFRETQLKFLEHQKQIINEKENKLAKKSKNLFLIKKESKNKSNKKNANFKKSILSANDISSPISSISAASVHFMPNSLKLSYSENTQSIKKQDNPPIPSSSSGDNLLILSDHSLPPSSLHASSAPEAIHQTTPPQSELDPLPLSSNHSQPTPADEQLAQNDSVQRETPASNPDPFDIEPVPVREEEYEPIKPVNASIEPAQPHSESECVEVKEEDKAMISDMPPPPPPMMIQFPKFDEDKMEKPKSKVKALHWSKIAPVSYQDSFWSKIQSPDIKLPTASLENLFSLQKPAEKKSKKEATNEKNKQVEFIPQKKSQNISILLKKFKLETKEDFQNIKNGILEFNKAVVTELFIEQFNSFLPSSEEIESIQGYMYNHPSPDSFYQLPIPERFYFEISSISHLPERLEIFYLLFTFHNKFNPLLESASLLSTIFSQLFNADHFCQLLKIILGFGNFFNHGSSRGCAHGFKLTSLHSLISLKTIQSRGDQDSSASAKQESFLHFLANFMGDNHPEIEFRFIEELNGISRGSQIPYSNLLAEINNLSQFIHRCDNFFQIIFPPDQLSNEILDIFNFISNCKAQMKDLQEKLKVLESEYVKVGKFYGFTGHELATLPLNEFILIISSFSESYLKVKKEIILEKKRIKELEKRKLAQEQRKMEIDIKKKLKAEKENEVGGVVDNLFDNLCGGNFRKRRNPRGNKTKFVSTADSLESLPKPPAVQKEIDEIFNNILVSPKKSRAPGKALGRKFTPPRKPSIANQS